MVTKQWKGCGVEYAYVHALLYYINLFKVNPRYHDHHVKLLFLSSVVGKVSRGDRGSRVSSFLVIRTLPV